MSGDHEDADPQMELPPEDDRRLHGEYPTRPNLPSLRTLNPGPPTSGSIVTRGPYQETDWPNNSSGAVPEEAAAAAPEVVISAREQAPDAAADASVVDRSDTPLMKGPPLRTMTSAPSLSSMNPKPTGPLSRSVSAPSHQIQCKEGTIHPVEDLSNQTYAEVKGINNKLFRKYYKDIEISDDLIPEQYKVQYDIALLYADDDLDEAMAFRTLIGQFGITDTGERPSVCTLDYNPDMMEGSKIRQLEDAISISTMVFMFITKKFCEDRWAEFEKEACLMALVNDPGKRKCIRTVLTQKRDEQDITKAYKIPFGLQVATTINLFKITQGESLANLNLTEEDIMKQDRHFLKFLKEMLSRVLPIRKMREKQVAKDREKFIMEKKRQLALEEVKRLAEEDARRFYEREKCETWEQHLKQRFEIGDIAEPPVSTINSGARGPTHGGVAAPVESRLSCNHHLYNPEGSSIPAMPPSKQTIVNVSSGNIVQVGNYTSATVLNRDEDGNIYVPAGDDTAGKQTLGGYSDSDSEDISFTGSKNSYTSSYTGDIDTSEDPHYEVSYREDFHSISERIVIGQEPDSVTQGTNSGPANAAVAQRDVPPARNMAAPYDREPSMNSEGSEARLASLFDHVNQKKELWLTTPSVEPIFHSISESGTIPSTETAGRLNSVDEFTAFVEGENHDMQRPRPIQQIQLDTSTEMDGVELPSGSWSIGYAYPHHIDISYALGRSILTSIKGSLHYEEDKDLD